MTTFSEAQRTERKSAARQNFRVGLVDAIEQAEKRIARCKLARERGDYALGSNLEAAQADLAECKHRLAIFDLETQSILSPVPIDPKIARAGLVAAEQFDTALERLQAAILKLRTAAGAFEQRDPARWPHEHQLTAALRTRVLVALGSVGVRFEGFGSSARESRLNLPIASHFEAPAARDER